MSNRIVNIIISNIKTNETYYARSYPCSDIDNNGKIELYAVPVYYVYLEGTDNMGNSVKDSWKALRFMPYYNPKGFSNHYKTVGWVNSGLHSLPRKAVSLYKRNYSVSNTVSPYNGAIVLRDSFYIHAGPQNLFQIGWGAAGCVEIIGNFNAFKNKIKELSGFKSLAADDAIEKLVQERKLYVEVQPAIPPNIKSNFHKEVMVKR